MFVGKKIEVQLFGGTIGTCETFPRVSPFDGDSTVSRIKNLIYKITKKNSK